MRTVLLALFVVAVANAFVPAARPGQQASKTTSLSFGFLKDLGLEKPSWLPDFGGKKEETETTDDAPEASAEGEGGETTEEVPKEE